MIKVTQLKNIANALNVYNSLYSNEKIVSFDGAKDSFDGAKQKLISKDIYFDEISSDIEKDCWALIEVDEEGIADLK